MATQKDMIKVPLIELRPTQLSVGMLEVERKHSRWCSLGRKERKERLRRQPFPAVLGPRGRLYIVDRHHTGRALLEAGEERAFVTVIRDLSWLRPDRFCRVMEFYGWLYPFDERGRRRGFSDLPRSLVELRDNPHRSLAGMVRDAGGYAKVEVPFAEFLWADFLRPRVPSREIAAAPSRAVRVAIRHARAPDASHLPGWNGDAQAIRIAG